MNEFEAWEEITRKWREVNKMQDICQRWYDELGGAIMYLLEYSKRNNITLPNKDRLWSMVDNIHNTMTSLDDYRYMINSYNLPPKNKHPFSTPDDETEPKSCIPYQNRLFFAVMFMINQSMDKNIDFGSF